MRLGGQVFLEDKNPESWSHALQRAGFSAAACPINGDDDSSELEDYMKAPEGHDILISEVGAWSNPLITGPF